MILLISLENALHHLFTQNQSPKNKLLKYCLYRHCKFNIVLLERKKKETLKIEWYLLILNGYRLLHLPECLAICIMKNIKAKTIKVIIFTGTKKNIGQCRINIFILYEEYYSWFTNEPLCWNDFLKVMHNNPFIFVSLVSTA